MIITNKYRNAKKNHNKYLTYTGTAFIKKRKERKKERQVPAKRGRN